MRMRGNYSPKRVVDIFLFLATLFLLIRKKERLFFLSPLAPKRLKETVLGLGASFIKLSQVLATRADFFSQEYLDELKTLHDDIEPMTPKDFQAVFRRAFENDPFAQFETTPIASASIGQVHKALLKDGRIVAVKLRRNGIEKRIKADIRILSLFHALFRPLFSQYTKNSIEAVIIEFSRMITREIDFAVELANLKTFSKTYAQSGVHFPVPFENLCGKDAIVMSFEHGTRIDDTKAIKAMGIDFKEVLEKLIVFYTHQMLINGYFHADPHPGNLLVSEQGELVLLDFGMVKKIPNATRIAIIDMIRSANEKDFDLYITSCKRLGVIAQDAPQEQMQELAERMFEIFENDRLDAATMQSLAFDLLESMKELPFKLPQEAIYILRASAIIEGIGTNYIENFNGVKDILPVLRHHIPAALGAEKGFVGLLGNEIVDFPVTIKRVKKIISDASENAFLVQLSPQTIDLIARRLKTALRPFAVGTLLIVCAFFSNTLAFDHKEVVSVFLFLAGLARILLAL